MRRVGGEVLWFHPGCGTQRNIPRLFQLLKQGNPQPAHILILFLYFLIWVLPIKSDKTELRIQIHNRMEKNKNLVESFLIGFLLPFL